jgi:hypothetical protein
VCNDARRAGAGDAARRHSGRAAELGRRRPHRWQIAGAEAALRRLDRQVARQALRARAHRRRVAEDRYAAALLDQPVGGDDREVDDRHEDEEVDDRGDERTEIEEGAVTTAGPQLPAEPRTLRPLSRGDQRVDDVGRERVDQRAERQRDDQSDGDHDDVTTHEEVLEPTQHDSAPSSRRVDHDGRTLQPDPSYA